MKTLIRNCRIVTPGREIIEQGSIAIAEDETIAAAGRNGVAEGEEFGTTFDAEGLMAFPGFMDIHTHGANGHDLSEGTEEAVRTVAEAKLREGVTTYVPTTWTETPTALTAMAAAAAAYRERPDFARAPFLHVEGPYLNPIQAGAQDPTKMRDPDAEEILTLHRICPVGLVSVAIELEGALDFIATMKANGIVTSAAHSGATYEEFVQAKEAGLAHLTHFCNQMSPLHHRSIGLVGAGLLDDDIRIEVICDTIHLCPDMLQLTFKHVSLDRIMMITDSMNASWLGDGDYHLGERTITVTHGVARIPAGNLAGSTLKYNEGLRNVVRLTGLPLPELARATCLNQASSLGLTDRGRLEPGYLGDVVLLNDEFQVRAVFVGGEQRV